MHLIEYSVSASVRSVDADDLNSGPRCANSGIADNCSNMCLNTISYNREIDLNVKIYKPMSLPTNLSCRVAADFSVGLTVLGKSEISAVAIKKWKEVI